MLYENQDIKDLVDIEEKIHMIKENYFENIHQR